MRCTLLLYHFCDRGKSKCIKSINQNHQIPCVRLLCTKPETRIQNLLPNSQNSPKTNITSARFQTGRRYIIFLIQIPIPISSRQAFTAPPAHGCISTHCNSLKASVWHTRSSYPSPAHAFLPR